MRIPDRGSVNLSGVTAPESGGLPSPVIDREYLICEEFRLAIHVDETPLTDRLASTSIKDFKNIIIDP